MYTRKGNQATSWHTIPFIDEELPFDDDAANENEWQLDYFQHLLDHPELVIANDVSCSHVPHLHSALSAINVVKTGLIDQLFQCSDGNVNCRLLALRQTSSLVNLSDSQLAVGAASGSVECRDRTEQWVATEHSIDRLGNGCSTPRAR